MIRLVPVLFGVIALTGCPPAVETGDSGDLVVVAGPTLTHETSAIPVPEGQPHVWEVTATDPDGVQGVTAFWRRQGESAWQAIELTLSEGRWRGSLPGQYVNPPAVEYYFKATDQSDFRAFSYLPAEGLDGPYTVDVSPVGRALPYVEGFEGTGTLYRFGWQDHSEGFAGFRWETTNARAHTGSGAVQHRRGSAAAEPVVDWLVSQAVDLRLEGEARAQVTWHELGDYTELADHSLWISTGSPDPADGDYELVTALSAPPEDAWGRSATVDLGTWAGAPSAYLAWRYAGQFSDLWMIDDVRVEALAADLRAEATPTARLRPGGAGSLRVRVENAAGIATGALTLTARSDGATFGAPVAVEALAGYGAREVELDLTVNEGWPDHSQLPLVVTLTEGERVVDLALSVFVGEPAYGFLTFQLDADAVMRVELGTGDPAEPDLLVPVFAGPLVAGTHRLSAAIPDDAPNLPPAPGAGRWWLRVNSPRVGRVTEWGVAHGGRDHVARDEGTFLGGFEEVYHLPARPSPVVLSSTFDPATLEPDMDVDWRFVLFNDGEGTVGTTTARLISDDPDVVVPSEPVVLYPNGMGPGFDTAVTFPITVTADQDDSQPVRLTLEIADTVESFAIPVSLRAPWPVLALQSLTIDDAGDRDGLLDEGETANLDVRLANAGDRNSFGTVRCELVAGVGEAVVEILTGDGNFGRIDAGDFEDEDDFAVKLVLGAPGDRIDLTLACADERTTYEIPLTLEVGNRGWTRLSTRDDPSGDDIGAGFDLKNVRYRADGTTLELEFEGYNPLIQSTLFLESWMVSDGAPFAYYQLVSQSGSNVVRGYDALFGQFIRVSEPTIAYPDPYRATVTVNLTDLDLTVDRLRLGVATGFCGGGTYFCDHLPNGWGDPYNAGLSTPLFLDVRW